MSIDVARNWLVERFLASDCNFLMFIDNDATFHPDAVARLRSHDVPMVCGCMYTKALPPRPTTGDYLGVAADGKEYYGYGKVAYDILLKGREHGFNKAERNDILFPQTKTDLRPIDGAGMHFCMIRRDVFEKVERPYFILHGKTGAGEDFYFSKKVRKAGFPIYVDLSVQTGHVLGEEDCESHNFEYGVRELMLFVQEVPTEQLKEQVVDQDMGRWEIG